MDTIDDLDFILNDVQALDEMDNLDPNILAKLEKKNTSYLIKKYMTKTHYKESIKLLQKYLRSSYKNIMIIEQIYLTCIMFEDYKLLDMNIQVYDKVQHPRLDRIRFYYELDKYEIKNISCKSEEYSYFVSKCRKLLDVFDINLLEVYMEFEKCCKCEEKCKIETEFLFTQDYLNKMGDKDLKLLRKKFYFTFKRRTDYIKKVIKINKPSRPVLRKCTGFEIATNPEVQRPEIRGWE